MIFTIQIAGFLRIEKTIKLKREMLSFKAECMCLRLECLSSLECVPFCSSYILLNKQVLLIRCDL